MKNLLGNSVGVCDKEKSLEAIAMSIVDASSALSPQGTDVPYIVLDVTTHWTQTCGFFQLHNPKPHWAQP